MIGEKLADCTLANLPQSQWPKADLVNSLNADYMRLKRMGLSDPFVFSVLRKWLPDWAATSPAEELSEPSHVSKEIAELAQVRGLCSGRRPSLGVRGRQRAGH